MKNLFSIFCSGIVMVFALQSCTQPKVDTGREMASIDSLAGLRVVAYRDSLRMNCMNSVMTLAQARADSMMQTAMKKTPGKKPKPKPVTPTTPVPTTTNPKTDKMTGNTQSTLEDKKDKMSGDTTKTLNKKKDKMNSNDSIPK
ncbi:MAG: hypothetical protein H0V61_04625 [Chitinophagales bacterium]|nr:hypothetical protein [Chitinophagales bacterium]